MNGGRLPGSDSDSRMTIEGVNSALEERGIIWQGIGFALVGALSLPLLWIYSDADHWSIGIYRLAATQLNWAFVIALALVIESIREVFKTSTEIRRAARQQAVAKAVEKEKKRTKSLLRKHGVELSPEAERDLFEKDG